MWLKTDVFRTARKIRTLPSIKIPSKAKNQQQEPQWTEPMQCLALTFELLRFGCDGLFEGWQCRHFGCLSAANGRWFGSRRTPVSDQLVKTLKYRDHWRRRSRLQISLKGPEKKCFIIFFSLININRIGEEKDQGLTGKQKGDQDAAPTP